jgi:hypothetical protein
MLVSGIEFSATATCPSENGSGCRVNLPRDPDEGITARHPVGWRHDGPLVDLPIFMAGVEAQRSR